MAKKVLVARRFGNGSVLVRVHLDTTKLLADNSTPDPAYVQDYNYGPRPTGFATQPLYETMIAGEIQIAANADPRSSVAGTGAQIGTLEGNTF